MASLGSFNTSSNASLLQSLYSQNSVTSILPPQERLEQYQPGQLAYDARLASHEEQADGANEPYGPQGDIFLQTLLNGNNNGEASVFLNTPQRTAWFLEAMIDSINPKTGQLTGNFLRQSIADSYYQGTGIDILPELDSEPSLPANTSPSVVYENIANVQNPGGVQGLEQQSGWDDDQVIADALWGHDQFNNDQITNTNTIAFLQDALNDPTNELDYPLVHLDQGTEAYTQGLLNSSNPAQALNEGFLQSQAQSFSNPELAEIGQTGQTSTQTSQPSSISSLFSSFSSLLSRLNGM